MSKRSIPQEFIQLLRSYGNPAAETLIEALENSEPEVSFRVNALKGIEAAGKTDPVPWLPGRGFYLAERPVFAADPKWHQGLYYVQDASSMAMTAVVDRIIQQYFAGQPVRYLDACAAPGGKTISAIEALPAGSAVLANEYDRRRASALIENTGKHGFPALAISTVDAAALGKLGPVFDIVAVDAPCSGEGMMRKEEEAVNQWSQGLIDSCASLQRHILEGVWSALKPGGVLIYSTCTFNRLEDEENLRFIAEELGAESIDLDLDRYDGIQKGFSTPYHCYRFMPGCVRGEGLFIAALRKAEADVREPKMKASKAKTPDAASAFAAKYLIEPEKYTLVPSDADSFSAVPAQQADFFAYLAANLKLSRVGLPLCRIKGRDALPCWELAFSTAFNQKAMPAIELDRQAALEYLHGESLHDIDASTPRGFALATYQGRPLGFVKNIGNRANNLYPEALRLRMTPADMPEPTPLIL